MKDRIRTLSKRMDRLDNYVKSNNNWLTYEKWWQYFRLKNDCSKEYAILIRLKE